MKSLRISCQLFLYHTKRKGDVLVHGDFSLNHLLFDQNQMVCSVLDFGDSHVGDFQEDFLYYALKYERIAKRRGKKRAIVAIARMILTAIYSMLSTGEIWNPVDLFKVDMPEHLKEQQLQKAMKQAVRFLEAQGLTVLDSA